MSQFPTKSRDVYTFWVQRELKVEWKIKISKIWRFRIFMKSFLCFCGFLVSSMFLRRSASAAAQKCGCATVLQCINMEEDGVAFDKKTGVVLCSLFATVLYLNTLSAEFAYDDKLECDLFCYRIYFIAQHVIIVIAHTATSSNSAGNCKKLILVRIPFRTLKNSQINWTTIYSRNRRQRSSTLSSVSTEIRFSTSWAQPWNFSPY